MLAMRKRHEFRVEEETDPVKARAAWNRYAPYDRHFLPLQARMFFDRFVLQELRFAGHENVLSIGSGSGALETYLAKYKVPNGKVTAVDVSDEMVKQNLQLAKNTQTRNIFPVVGSAQRLPVRANSQDVVLAINLPLADREAVAQLLQTVHRVIKRGPDSRLVLIKGITRQDQETQELRIMERAGFERVHVERYGVFNQIVMFETLKLREKEK